MPSILADLVVNLLGNDADLLAASRRSTAALEETAATALKSNATISSSSAAAGASTAASAGKMEQALTKVAAAGKYAGVALVAIGGYAVETATKFQGAMELIHTQAGASQQAVDELSKRVMAMAPTVGIGPDQLAEGLYHVESAFASTGITADNAMAILKYAAMNAATGMADMEDATQAMIGTLAVGFKDIHDAADAAAFLNQIVGTGDMRMQQLSSAIATNVLPTFAEAGLGMKDFGAAIATMTDNVTPANMAATRLRMTIALLAAPTKAAFNALTSVGLGADEANKALANRQYLEHYGISISKLSEDLHKPDGLLVAVQDLKTHLESAGLTAVEQDAVIQRAFGGGRTSAAIQTLLMESDRLKSKYEELGTQSERAQKQQEAWAATQATFKQQTHELGASLQVMGIQLGDKLLPPLTKFVGWLTSHQGAMQAFFIVLIIMLGLFTAAWLAMSLTMMANPVFWIVVAIVAAIALLAIGIYELVKHWDTVWKWIKQIAMDVWHWLVSAWNATWNAIMAVVHWIEKEIIDPIIRAWNSMVQGFKNAWAKVMAVVDWIHNNIIQPIVNMFNAFVHTVSAIWNGITAFFKKWWPLLLVIFATPIAILLATWNHFHNQIEAFAKMIWGKISGFFKMEWDGIVIIAKIAWGLVRDWIINPVIYVWNLLVMVSDKIKALLSAAWDTIVGSAKFAWGKVKDWIVNPLISARDWVMNLIGEIGDRISNGFDNAWNRVKSIGSRFIDLGKNIVMGIIQGIGDAGGQLFDKLKHLANDALDAAKKFLGVNSPSLLFSREVGTPIAEGIAHGIDQGMKLPQKTLGVLVTNLIKTPSSVIRGTSPSTLANAMPGSPGNDTVTVNVDGKKLFDVLVPYAQRNKIRNNSTFLT